MVGIILGIIAIFVSIFSGQVVFAVVGILAIVCGSVYQSEKKKEKALDAQRREDMKRLQDGRSVRQNAMQQQSRVRSGTIDPFDYDSKKAGIDPFDYIPKDSPKTEPVNDFIFVDLPISDNELLEYIFLSQFAPRGMLRSTFALTKDLQSRELQKVKAELQKQINAGASPEKAVAPIREKLSLLQTENATKETTVAPPEETPEQKQARKQRLVIPYLACPCKVFLSDKLPADMVLFLAKRKPRDTVSNIMQKITVAVLSDESNESGISKREFAESCDKIYGFNDSMIYGSAEKLERAERIIGKEEKQAIAQRACA